MVQLSDFAQSDLRNGTDSDDHGGVKETSLRTANSCASRQGMNGLLTCVHKFSRTSAPAIMGGREVPANPADLGVLEGRASPLRLHQPRAAAADRAVPAVRTLPRANDQEQAILAALPHLLKMVEDRRPLPMAWRMPSPRRVDETGRPSCHRAVRVALREPAVPPAFPDEHGSRTHQATAEGCRWKGFVRQRCPRGDWQ